MTSDSLTGRRSCRCSGPRSAQRCCCSHSLGPDIVDLHWPEEDSKMFFKVRDTSRWGFGKLTCYWTNLKDIVSRFHIRDVDPLAVNVCVVGIITSWTQALLKEQHVSSHLVMMWASNYNCVHMWQNSTLKWVVNDILTVILRPGCVRCRRSACSSRSHRKCPPDRSWPCGPLPPNGESGNPAARSGWTRPCCGSACGSATVFSNIKHEVQLITTTGGTNHKCGESAHASLSQTEFV